MPEEKQKKSTKSKSKSVVSAARALDKTGESETPDFAAKRLLENSKENARSFKKKLSAIKRRQRFITWGESGAYAHDLTLLLEELKSTVLEPRIGLECVSAFIKADVQILDRLDDSSGSVSDVFLIDANELLVSYAKLYKDKEWVLELVIELYQDNLYGARDRLFATASQYLSEPLMRSAVDKLWKLAETSADKSHKGRWLHAIGDLAKQLKDPLLLEKSYLAGGDSLSIADIIQVAKLQLECGDISAALSYLERVPADESYMADARDKMLISIFKVQEDLQKLTEASLRMFRRQRCLERFQILLEALGEDKRAEVLKSEVEMILQTPKFESVDAEFLLQVGAVDEVEEYVLCHARKLNGYFYEGLLPLAQSLEKLGRLVSASVIYRALLDSLLGRGVAKNYGHAVKYLKKLDALAAGVGNWLTVDSHAVYLAELRQAHKLKYSFWSKYTG